MGLIKQLRSNLKLTSILCCWSILALGQNNAESEAPLLLRIQEQIFSPKCGVPPCHDNSFEPNFTTLQSSYATLVNQPIIKNNLEASFAFRVVHFDTANSLLWERLINCCFVNENDRMPQSDLGGKLPDHELALIADWILKGAKPAFEMQHDQSTIQQTLVNRPPIVRYYEAKYENGDEVRRMQDSIHLPLVISKSGKSEFELSVFVFDSENDHIKSPQAFIEIAENNKFDVDTKRFHAEGHLETAIHFFKSSVSTEELKTGVHYFLRFVLTTSDETQFVIYPNAKTPIDYQSHWSLLIID